VLGFLPAALPFSTHTSNQAIGEAFAHKIFIDAQRFLRAPRPSHSPRGEAASAREEEKKEKKGKQEGKKKRQKGKKKKKEGRPISGWFAWKISEFSRLLFDTPGAPPWLGRSREALRREKEERGEGGKNRTPRGRKREDREKTRASGKPISLLDPNSNGRSVGGSRRGPADPVWDLEISPFRERMCRIGEK